MNNFSELTLELTKILTKYEKKHFGIFFTPTVIINTLLTDLKKYFKESEYYNILEPSIGSCNFIDPILEHFKNVKVTGIELNSVIYNKLPDHYEKLDLLNEDFINYISDKKYDIVIGNPPYFILTKDKLNEYVKTLEKQFTDFNPKIFSGKTNIFCLFLYKSLQLLKENGIVSFVIPSSVLNTNSYGNLRKYISENFKILDIKFIYDDSFIDTKQKTLILTIQNSKPEDSKFVLTLHNLCIFTNEKPYFEKIIKNSRFLIDEGDINICVGNIIWNKHKDSLRTVKSKGVYTLLYNFNIVNNSIVIKPAGIYNKKSQYIEIEKTRIVPPAIVINRGNGNATLNLKFALIEEDFGEFYAENHLYVITGYITKLNKIFKSLSNENTIEFLNRCVPNNCLTKKDILNFLPL